MGIFDKFRKTKKGREETEKLRNREIKGADKKEEKVQKKIVASEKVLKSEKPQKQELRRFDNAHNVLLRPLVTEKISNLGMYNQYAFEVKQSANKIQIKKAIETYYHVKPVRVNIINIHGKNVRWGRTRGKTKGKKKAIITLRQGDRIEVYEGV